MSDMDNYINKYSKFLVLGDGESFEGLFDSAKITANPFDPEKELMLYTFIIDEYSKQFKTASVKFARAMKNIEAGTKLRITRHGAGLKTNYDITVL